MRPAESAYFSASEDGEKGPPVIRGERQNFHHGKCGRDTGLSTHARRSSWMFPANECGPSTPELRGTLENRLSG